MVDGDSTSLKDRINVSETTMDDSVGKGADQVLKQNIDGEALQNSKRYSSSPKYLTKECQSLKSMSKCSIKIDD